MTFLDSHRGPVDNRAVRVLGSLLVIAALVGCKRQPAGERTCDQVGARFLAIARDDLARQAKEGGGDATVRDGVAGLLAPMRDSMVRACRQDRWSAEARACYADAPSQAAFTACEVKLTGEQRQLLEQAAAKGIQGK